MYFASSWIFFYTFYLQAEVSKNLKDMSKMALRYNEQERMLDCERRSLAGLQLQLDQATQSLRKKENEAEVASQQATRLDMQLTLANKEISVLRDECQKLEVHTYLHFVYLCFILTCYNFSSNYWTKLSRSVIQRKKWENWPLLKTVVPVLRIRSRISCSFLIGIFILWEARFLDAQHLFLGRWISWRRK